jgi:hypothetical protein
MVLQLEYFTEHSLVESRQYTSLPSLLQMIAEHILPADVFAVLGNIFSIAFPLINDVVLLGDPLRTKFDATMPIMMLATTTGISIHSFWKCRLLICA